MKHIIKKQISSYYNTYKQNNSESYIIRVRVQRLDGPS